MTPKDAFTDLRHRVFMTGSIFPTWAVPPSATGHHIALVSERPADPPCPWVVALVVRAETLAPLVDAGLLRLGKPEPIPEYEGRRGFRWEPGAGGRGVQDLDALTGRAVRCGCALPNGRGPPSSRGSAGRVLFRT
ncbi:hypothetical protein GCM10022384_07540 [Streptomyces marokkonensis]|uniref:Uncharacterized protein n=1 Tax=Streptomyces marokkonensis TaxID=324855 RepID=A0ABP7NZY6_9ACTN